MTPLCPQERRLGAMEHSLETRGNLWKPGSKWKSCSGDRFQSRHRSGLVAKLAALVSGIAVLIAIPALSESPRALVREGNKKYAGGDYAKALESYSKASVEAPGSPVILFNQGDALYRQREFQKSREAFEKAAQKASDLPFEAKCRFNIGNVDLQLAKRQADSDPKKAISLYERAIRSYQDALRLKPGYPEAAHNLEVARILMKNLIDELSKNPGGCQAKQEQSQELQKELQQLIEEQEKELGDNRSISERQKKEDQASTSKDVQKLASDQRQTGEKTGKLGEKMDKASKEQPDQQDKGGSPLEKAKEEVDKARQEQTSSAGSLDQKDLQGAKPKQEKALEHLKKALEEMGGEPQQGGQQQQQEQQGKKEDQAQGSEGQDQQKKQEGQEKKAAAAKPKDGPKPRDEKAQDILREEMENKDKQMKHVQGGYTPVDKDW